MKDDDLVEALRSRNSGAPAAAYDAYANRLYAYCWFQLRDHEAAQAAVRDTFVVAEAHIDKLCDSGSFGPWLYAIAHLECARRRHGGDAEPDLPIASRGQGDVDQRVMAWRAVQAMPARSREMLELRVRHQLTLPSLAAVFGLTVKAAQQALGKAKGELDEALTVEHLVHEGPRGCPSRAAIVRDRRGGLTAYARQALLRHARDCQTCSACRPLTVAPAIVYGLLPVASPPPTLRSLVTSCFLDPELVSYRLFVATRVSDFTLDGFPVQARSARSVRRLQKAAARKRRFGRGMAVAGTAGLCLAVVGTTLVWFTSTAHRNAHNASELRPSVAIPSAVPSVGSVPGPPSPIAGNPKAVQKVTADYSAVPAPLSAEIPAPAKSREQPDGTLVIVRRVLDLGDDRVGTLQLRAYGGSVAWRAQPGGPLVLSRSAGTLRPGQSQTLTIAALPSLTHQGAIVFQPGDLRVTVQWPRRSRGPGERVPTTAPGTPPTTSRPTATGSAGQSPSPTDPAPTGQSPTQPTTQPTT
jgi:DNA-directed RNA polymerase specialized sigma24 family protein